MCLRLANFVARDFAEAPTIENSEIQERPENPGRFISQHPYFQFLSGCYHNIRA
jgi:hypothetical protein